MRMIIQTPHFKAREELTAFVQEKISKLETFSDRILECRVFLKVEKSNSPGNKVCELKLIIPGNDIFASSQSDTFEEAVVQAIEALKPQLERWKGSKKGKFYTSLQEIEPELES